MASNLYNTASVLVPKGAAGRASVIDAYRPAFNVLQSIGITRNDANGSFRNQQGLIEFAAANVPRFNWDEGDSCPKLLVEPSRENLITYSEQFDNAAWTKSNASISADATTSPDGTANADTFTEDASNSTHFLRQTISVTATDYTFSCFVKKNTGRDWVYINQGGANARAYFNINEGYVGTTQNTVSEGLVDMGNGYYYCYVTATQPSAASRVFDIGLANADNSDTYTGDGTSGIYAWGAQLEAGSYATSYIKTEATTQTRAADVISQTGLASLIGDSEGTLYVEMEAFADYSANSSLSLNDGSVSNTVRIRFTSSNGIQGNNLFSGSTQSILTTTSVDIKNINKCAFTYSLNDFAFYVNGSQIGVNSSGSVYSDGTLTNFSFNRGDSNEPFYGKISVLAWWQARLSNSVLESLTSYETYEEMAATLDYTID